MWLVIWVDSNQKHFNLCWIRGHRSQNYCWTLQKLFWETDCQDIGPCRVSFENNQISQEKQLLISYFTLWMISLSFKAIYIYMYLPWERLYFIFLILILLWRLSTVVLGFALTRSNFWSIRLVSGMNLRVWLTTCCSHGSIFDSWVA